MISVIKKNKVFITNDNLPCGPLTPLMVLILSGVKLSNALLLLPLIVWGPGYERPV